MFLFSRLIFLSLQFLKRVDTKREKQLRQERQGGSRVTQPAAALQRKWREILSLHFLILSLFPPSLSISYIKICHILSQNVKYGIFVANVTKTEHTRYEEIILGRIRCEEAPQVVPAWYWVRTGQYCLPA